MSLFATRLNSQPDAQPVAVAEKPKHKNVSSEDLKSSFDEALSRFDANTQRRINRFLSLLYNALLDHHITYSYEGWLHINVEWGEPKLYDFETKEINRLVAPMGISQLFMGNLVFRSQGEIVEVGFKRAAPLVPTTDEPLPFDETTP